MTTTMTEPETMLAGSSVPRLAIVNGKQLQKWPKNLYIPPQALEVLLDTFQGPLDLLLYLIRKQNLDILDIPIAHITSQYMEYVELMHHFNLDLAAEYLVMAALLAEIKSRMLLPVPTLENEEDDDDPRTVLVMRLQEYERFSQVAQAFDALPQLERELYLVASGFDPPEPEKVFPKASLNDLVAAFREVLDRTEQYQPWTVAKEALSVREKMAHILERIQSKQFMKFEDLLIDTEGRPGVVVNFIAILELMHGRMLMVVQDTPFSPLQIKGVAGG